LAFTKNALMVSLIGHQYQNSGILFIYGKI